MVAPIYIGFDRREQDAYRVCVSSLLKHATIPLHVQPLHQDELRRAGLYRRAPEPGQAWNDWIGGRGYSTEFTFTRFLVPALMQWRGWALFVDCDFLWRADIAELWRQRDPKYAVQVVKHDFRPTDDLKMDGREQYAYGRKLWSALMLVNASHEGWKRLTVDDVNLRDKLWLHGFSWLQDDEIGGLDPAWHWVEGLSDGEPKAVHMTAGVPTMPGYGNVAYAGEWRLHL